MKRMLVILALLAACKPDFGERDSRIVALRILAVRGEPAEAAPGTTTRFTVLAATPDGPLAPGSARWDFCATPKLLTENGATSPGCLGPGGVRPIGEGPAVSAIMPVDACSLFGPNVSSADLRPRDPDVTGGFFQPVRVTVASGAAEAIGFGFERIGCALANASSLVVADFAARYAPNENPELAAVTAALRGAPVAFDDVPAGATITLAASWTPETAERYVAYDLASQSLVERRESLRVSWFATDGTFDEDRTGRDETEVETVSENRWTAPAVAKATSLFVVLRDARGGTAFGSYVLRTR